MFQERERKTIQVIAASTDLFDGDVDGDYVDCAKLIGLKFILALSAGEVGTGTVTVEKDADGSGAGTTIPFYYRKITSAGVVGALTAAAADTGFATDTDAEKTYEIFVNLAELGSGYRYVRLCVDELVNAAVEGMALAELQPRTV